LTSNRSIINIISSTSYITIFAACADPFSVVVTDVGSNDSDGLIFDTLDDAVNVISVLSPEGWDAICKEEVGVVRVDRLDNVDDRVGDVGVDNIAIRLANHRRFVANIAAHKFIWTVDTLVTLPNGTLFGTVHDNDNDKDNDGDDSSDGDGLCCSLF
jgi:hypothetical protein